MAFPTFQAAGTLVHDVIAVSPAWPAHQAGDIALLLVETANEAVTLTDAQGFVEVTGSPQGTGTAGSTSATRLTVFWCRATSGAMAAPTTNDPGNHIVARIITFRGCIATGNPWDVISEGVDATDDNSLVATGDTTTGADRLVVIMTTSMGDVTTARWSGWANADLANIAEIIDAGGDSGNGGGLAAATGEKAAAGAYGNTTATHVATTTKGWMTIALVPAASGSSFTPAWIAEKLKNAQGRSQTARRAQQLRLAPRMRANSLMMLSAFAEPNPPAGGGGGSVLDRITVVTIIGEM